jgi:hypothetical protein
MCISPYAIVTVALSLLAGSSPLAPRPCMHGGHPGTGRYGVGPSRVGLAAASANSVASIMRCTVIAAALGLVPALSLPSQIAKTPPTTGSTAAYKSLTPTRVISFVAIVAALVLLRSPAALAVTPLNDGNIRTAATAWIDKPAAATATYGAISGWNTAAVGNMAQLFQSKSTFNADISKWNVARVSAMYA